MTIRAGAKRLSDAKACGGKELAWKATASESCLKILLHRPLHRRKRVAERKRVCYCFDSTPFLDHALLWLVGRAGIEPATNGL